LYAFCANDSIDLFDYLGFTWDLQRKGGNRAHGKPGNGDTVADLARTIRLDEADYRIWLKPVGPTRLPGSATEPITTCSEFTVPNTVFVDIGPRFSSSDPISLKVLREVSLTFTFLNSVAQQTGDLYASHGFNVVRTQPATASDMQSHLESQDIHAYVFAGHGSDGALNTTENAALFPRRYTQYGIQLMSLLACGSALDYYGENINSYPKNVARRGLFYGSMNNYTALLALTVLPVDFVWLQIPGWNEP
jgi:hypothetical protein